MSEVKDYVKWDDTMKLVIVNKSDLEESAVSDEEIERFKEEHSIDVMRCSAKTGANVTDAFAKLSHKLKDHREDKYGEG